MRTIIDFSRSAREAVQPATLVTGSPVSFYRSGTQRSSRRRSALRTKPALYSPRQMESDQVPPQQAILLVVMTSLRSLEDGAICGLLPAPQPFEDDVFIDAVLTGNLSNAGSGTGSQFNHTELEVIPIILTRFFSPGLVSILRCLSVQVGV